MTTQLLVRLPDDLVRRFKRSVAARQRSKFIERLLQEALPGVENSEDDPLYRAALAVEQDEELAAEMAEWEEATDADGIAEMKVTAPLPFIRNARARPDDWEGEVIRDRLLSPAWPKDQSFVAVLQTKGRPAHRLDLAATRANGQSAEI